MFKKLILLFAFTAVFSLTLKSAGDKSSAQGATIGVVDVETVVKEMPEALEADKQIKVIGQKYQDTLLAMQNDLETRYKAYEKQKVMMPADAQAKEEEALKAMQNTFLQYREEKFGQQNGELMKLQQKLLEPIRRKVKEAIEKVAKEEKMNFVLDKASSSILFSEDKFDITYKVLDKIKRNKE
ncbi:MAG: OmpH family outer membrane protein [Candidatus Kapabacteria bacterium]|nr:OmpH family outer membrane protein [Candidatus Kapabacteria bacterium]